MKVIYCFTILLFKEEFELNITEQKNLTEFCLFSSLIYVQAWISCPRTSDAPVNDLRLFQKVQQYASLNKAVSEAAIKKFRGHLWYLEPKFIPLALFSEKLSTEDEQMIVSRMKTCGENWDERGIKLMDSGGLENKALHDLVTSASTTALRSLRVDVDFLFDNDPSVWNDSPIFLKAKAIVDSLQVVNDSAERSVALMSTFNESITKTESEMQKLIQVVEDHRKRVPDGRKCTLNAYEPR